MVEHAEPKNDQLNRCNGTTYQDETNSKTDNTYYKLTMDTFITVDPMIGMKGITPYTFLEDLD